MNRPPSLPQAMAIPLADDTATNVTTDSGPAGETVDLAAGDETAECTQKDFECVDGTTYCLQGVSRACSAGRGKVRWLCLQQEGCSAFALPTREASCTAVPAGGDLQVGQRSSCCCSIKFFPCYLPCLAGDHRLPRW